MRGEFGVKHTACGRKNVLHECGGSGRCLSIEAFGISVQRLARMLEPKRKKRGSQLFETYRACVLILRNAL